MTDDPRDGKANDNASELARQVGTAISALGMFGVAMQCFGKRPISSHGVLPDKPVSEPEFPPQAGVVIAAEPVHEKESA